MIRSKPAPLVGSGSQRRTSFSVCTTKDALNLTEGKEATKEQSIIWALTLTLTGVLVAITVTLGTLIFLLLRQGETSLFQSEFNAVPTQLAAAVTAHVSRVDAVVAFTTKMYRNAIDGGYAGGVWPNATIPGFEGMMGDVMTMTNLRTIRVAPLLNGMTQRRQFEAYAKANYGNLNGPPSLKKQVANGTFIFKNRANPVWNRTRSAPQSYPRSTFPSVFLPLWQVSPLASNIGVIMLDIHGDDVATADKVLSTKALAVHEPYTIAQDTGTSVGPSTVVDAPLLDANNNVFAACRIVFTWSQILNDVISSKYNRVYVVLRTATTITTFALDGGVASLLGSGDLHDMAYDTYGTTLRDDPTNPLLSTFGYTINVYPSKDLYLQFVTNKPEICCAVSVIMILFTAAVFLLYRYFVERRQHALVDKLHQVTMASTKRAADEAAKIHALETAKMAKEMEREEQLNAMLLESIASSVHDLKSPVCALNLAVESALQSLQSPSEHDHKTVEETLQGMSHTLSTVSMIINRFSDAAKTADGRTLVPNVVPTDLRRVVDRVVDFMQWQAQGMAINIVVEPIPDILSQPVFTKEKWIVEDLLSVCSNAIKYSRESSDVPITLSVALEGVTATDRTVVFRVRDSGYALSADVLAKFFERRSVAERQQQGGMGLGLVCLKEHVKALGGAYGARPRADGHEGTEVWFSLPLKVATAKAETFHITEVSKLSMKSPSMPHQTLPTPRVQLKAGAGGPVHDVSPTSQLRLMEDMDEIPSEGQGHTPTAASKGSHRVSAAVESTTATVTQKTNVHLREALGDLPILIVDDSIAILKIMKKAIQNECNGVEIVEAKNGEEAYQAFVNNNGFDLVLTDIQMPVLDGIGFARKVRAYEGEKGIKASVIVGISANDQEKIASDAKAAGMDGFMSKPFKLSSLLDIINEIERSSSAQKGRLTRAASDGDGTGTLADKKLLMVDDSEPILRMMSNLISSKAKANVTQARDGSQAYECVESHAAAGAVGGGGGGGGGGGNEKSNHFDVIVTDIQMPTMDGFQAARKIRALESERGLVPAIIVGISANTSERMATDAQASGMDAFLTKPFNIHDLEQACGEIVSSRSHESGHGDVHIRRLSSSATIFVGGTATTADESTVKRDGAGGGQNELPV